MTLVMGLARVLVGLPTPAELIGDVFIPSLNLDQFFKLLIQYGGGSELKKHGIGSVLAGQIVAGTLLGLVYAALVEWDRGRAPQRARRFGLSRTGVVFVSMVGALVWLASLVFLRPVLYTNYRGLPAGPGTAVTVIGLLVVYASYGLALVAAYRALDGVPGGPAGQPDANRPAAGPARVPGRRHWRGHSGWRPAGCCGRSTSARRSAMTARATSVPTSSRDTERPVLHRDQERARSQRRPAGLAAGGDGTGRPARAPTPLMNSPRCRPASRNRRCPASATMSATGCPATRAGRACRCANCSKRPGRRGISRASSATARTTTWTPSPLDKAHEPDDLRRLGNERRAAAAAPRLSGRAIVVPGRFGEKSVKWVTRIELVAEDVKGFYERQGWGPTFVTQTFSPLSYLPHGQFVEPFAPASAAAISLQGVRVRRRPGHHKRRIQRRRRRDLARNPLRLPRLAR